MTARLPIRWRLTGWYAVLLAISLCLFGLGLYAGLRSTLLDGFNEQIQRQAVLAAASVQSVSGQPTLDQDTIANLDDDEHFVQLIDRDGAVLVDTRARLNGIAPNSNDLSAAYSGRTMLAQQSVDDSTFVIVTTPIWSGDRIDAVLRVGSSRDDIDETLGVLLTSLAIATPLVLLIATLGGYLIAGRALAPVATITTLAAGVMGDDLRARLNLRLPNDELGRLAQTFDGMLSRIEDAFERQRRFTGDAAHELRTPLSLMRSQVDLALARPRTNEEYREALQGFERDIERLTSLVSTLLTLARADEHRLPLIREPIDLAQTIDVTLEQFAERADERGIRLFDESTPASFDGDEDLLIHVLVNLVDNALAHTPSGGVISVGCRPQGEHVILWVADTGDGIATEHQPRIFDRFYRPDTGRVRATGGTGLGLAICQAIVDAHGGTIGLNSAPGKGTRVHVEFPRQSSLPLLTTS